MLLKLDPSWLMMAVAAVAVLFYIFALGMDAIMKSDGFGPIGNAIVMTAGFFLAILTANAYGIWFADATAATLAGLCGAFAALMILALIKAGLHRF